ncbi:MAG: helicase HerA domain-containing protein, partial [Rhabdochlamydiaceae bacterium]
MTTVLQTIQQMIVSQRDMLSLEIYKTMEYITLQIVSNSQDILEQAASSFGHIPGIKIRTKTKDVLSEMDTLYAKSVSTTKPLDTTRADTDFFPGILFFLSSLQANEKVGMQLILRAVDKRFSLHEKTQGIYSKARARNRHLTFVEEGVVKMYQAKQNEALFKVKINVFANNTLLLGRIRPLFQPLSTGTNRFTLHGEKRTNVTSRFIAPESLLTKFDFIRQRMGSYLTASEVTALYYPTCVLTGLYAPNQTRQLEAPHSFLKKGDDAIKIGSVMDNDNKKKSIYFPISNFTRHLYLIGKTGRGKSTLLLTLIQSLTQIKEATLFVFDPHGDLLSDIASHTSEKKVVNFSINTDKTYTFNPLFSFATDENEKASLR